MSESGGEVVLAPERQGRILRELERREAIRVTEVAAALQVSEMTVRRDIDALDARGLLRRVHGGAARQAGLSAAEPGFLVKADREREAKAAIAAAAVGLLSPGMTVFLTGGTTTYQLAQLLDRVPGLTVITNSLKVAEAIQLAGGSTKVVITGGERTPSEALAGPVATATVRRLHADLCIMGVHGISPDRGLSTPNLAEADTNEAMASAADRLMVLADKTKLGVVSLAAICPLSAVDVLVTDASADDSELKPYRAAIASVVVAPLHASNPQRKP
ncbi:DeoR/GlpR family DNA-binding transcription regulator [Paenarthrobacter sp. DKR-5]|uniref:DeoR/GlpR family DNA-binding transcription regulator n=1 Tax=Paenarthrobacter sp. DKR-5 TaxID=2835535 RepID=UPI00202790CE|nr:DeoR/GlpR family DNA-binding transcription regulator [Paenarthrobacter sp. DKR-5]